MEGRKTPLDKIAISRVKKKQQKTYIQITEDCTAPIYHPPWWQGYNYTDCILSRWVRSLFLLKRKDYPWDDAKLQLMVRLLFWISGKPGVIFEYHYSQAYFGKE